MRIRPGLLLFLLGIGLSAFSQRAKLDSLFKLLPQRKDSARVKVLLNIANSYRRVSLDSAIFYGNLSLREAQKISHLKYEYNAYYKLGDYHREQGNFKLSALNLEGALRAAMIRKDSVGMAQTYNSFGSTYQKMGDFPKGLSYFQRSLDIKERLGDKKGTANSLINIGNIYDQMSILNKAEEYILKGAAIKKELKDDYGTAGALNNLAIIYTRTKRPRKAIEILESVLRDYPEHLEPYLRSAVLGNLSEAYQQEKRPDKAMAYARECLAIREALGDSTEVSYTLITLADIEAENKDYRSALVHAGRALGMGTRMGILSQIWDANVSLAEIRAGMGDHARAVEHYRNVIRLADTLINSRAYTIIHEMDAKYESDKKEAEINRLNSEKKIHELELEKKEADISRQRWIMVFGLLLFACVAAVSVIVYRGYRQKQRSNEKLQSAYNTIEEKQKEILDSIYYARRIQRSLLASEKHIDKTIKRLKG